MALSSDENAALTVVTMGLFTFQGLLPPLPEVRRADPNDKEMQIDVRWGETAAVFFMLALGFLVSNMASSNKPGYYAVASTAAFIFLYEFTLRRRAH